MPTDPHRSGIETIANVDPVIHAPARLAIVTVLYVAHAADFVFIQRQTGLTRGNLSSHLTKLESARYITVEKRFVDRIPRTLVRLTEKGSEAFRAYRRQMTEVLKGLPK